MILTSVLKLTWPLLAFDLHLLIERSLIALKLLFVHPFLLCPQCVLRRRHCQLWLPLPLPIEIFFLDSVDLPLKLLCLLLNLLLVLQEIWVLLALVPRPTGVVFRAVRVLVEDRLEQFCPSFVFLPPIHWIGNKVIREVL